MATWTPSVYSIISLVGMVGNVLFLVALVRDSPLRKLLGGNIRALLIAHASNDLLYTTVGIPLYIMTLKFANWAVWQNNYWLCVGVTYAFWQFNYVSQWFLCMIALTRLIATVWPMYFRYSVSTSRWWNAFFFVVPLCCSMTVITLSLLMGWAEINSSPEQACVITAVAGTGDIYYRLDTFTVMGVPIGLLIYGVIAVKLAFACDNKIRPAAADAVSSTPSFTSAAQQQSHIAQRQSANKARAIKRTKILAACFLVQLVMIGPGVFIWFSGYYYPLSDSAPLLVAVLDTFLILSGAINPLIYALTSSEFRKALGRTVRCA